MAYQAIHPAKTVSGNSPKTRSLIEEAGQTFLVGTPVMVDAADGGLKAWTGNVADLIAGISAGAGANLATTGAGAPTPLMPMTGIGTTLTLADAVPNQTSAKMIPPGAPMNDGRCLFYAANDDTVFTAYVKTDQTTVPQMVGVGYGLTKDAGGNWFVDMTKTGANAVLTVVGLHSLDGGKLGGRVNFVFNAANSQIIA